MCLSTRSYNPDEMNTDIWCFCLFFKTQAFTNAEMKYSTKAKQILC